MTRRRRLSLQPAPAMSATRDGLLASEIAQGVTGRKISALAVTEAALARIAKQDPVLNSFTDVTADRARAKAGAVDAAIAAGEEARPPARGTIAGKRPLSAPGPLARAGAKRQPGPSPSSVYGPPT